MSPGFDNAHHDSFARAAHDGCVACHSGQVEAIDNSTHRLKITEASIGCENCHGPGSVHVTERTAGLPVSSEFDDSIVNPQTLSRSLNEDICAQCHLRAAGWSFVRGRDLSDFSPGLPLADYRVDFTRQDASATMEVVGHFEQMRASRCYIQSDSLTCTTCHNPHHSPGPLDKIQYYRNVCTKCHGRDSSACAFPETTRLAKSPEDDCVSCHMPGSETDIPHFTFTHHRIGIEHAPPHPQNLNNVSDIDLIPFADVSRLSPLDLQRCLGLAQQRSAKKMKPGARELVYRQAMTNLRDVYSQGMRDAEVAGGLAFLCWTQNDPDCLRFAEEALSAPDCEPATRIDSLIVLADMHLRQGSIKKAEKNFEELSQLRLRYTDWQMLGVCRGLQNHPVEAIEAFRKALSLKPGSIEIHALLAEQLEKSGLMNLAVEHRNLASRLQELKMDAIESH